METKVILVTCPDEEQAESIAKQIVASKLAGCVNIIPKIKSVYHWENKLEIDSEVLLIIKTTQNVKDLEAKIIELHTYDTPEFIVLETEYVNKKYRNWLSNLE